MSKEGFPGGNKKENNPVSKPKPKKDKRSAHGIAIATAVEKRRQAQMQENEDILKKLLENAGLDPKDTIIE